VGLGLFEGAECAGCAARVMYYTFCGECENVVNDCLEFLVVLLCE
jgi:hypothetical protein